MRENSILQGDMPPNGLPIKMAHYLYLSSMTEIQKVWLPSLSAGFPPSQQIAKPAISVKSRSNL
jgi:hypothetical protein